MSNVPEVLQLPPRITNLPRWCGWRKGPKADDPKDFEKKPCSAVTGIAKGWPDAMTTFEAARQGVIQNKLDGLGYSARKGDGITIVDIDDCMDDAGNLDPAVETWLPWFSLGYIEITPSGRGLRIFVLGNLQHNLTNTPFPGSTTGSSFEMYDGTSNHFVTVTGNHFRETQLEINDAQTSIDKLLKEIGFDPNADEFKSETTEDAAVRYLDRICKEAETLTEGRYRFLVRVCWWLGKVLGAKPKDPQLTFDNIEKRITEAISKTGWKELRHIKGQLYAGMRHPVSLVAKKSKKTGNPDFSDAGNAERLCQRYKGKLLYCYEMKTWLYWDGHRWKVDNSQRSRACMEETIRFHMLAAVKRRSQDEVDFLVECLNSWRLTNGLREAEKKMGVNSEMLDTHPFLLNFKNGTLNLETGELLPHNPEHLITKLVHHDYVSSASCPTFLSMLEHAIGKDALPYVQKLIGYSLTGDTSEKIFIVVWGDPDTGKSTFLEIIRRLIYEYATQIQIDTLLQKDASSSTAQEDLADLRGVRYASTSELDRNRKLSVSVIKRTTQGTGTITAARKYEHKITFAESHKLWFDTNYLPIIPSDEQAIWNRLVIVVFENPIPKDQQDKGLTRCILQDEAPGILAWAVAGERQRQATKGLGLAPSAFQHKKDTYRESMNELKQFVSALCETGAGFTTKKDELYKSYCDWHGEHPMSPKSFTKRMQNEGYLLDAGRRHFRGLRIFGDSEFAKSENEDNRAPIQMDLPTSTESHDYNVPF